MNIRILTACLCGTALFFSCSNLQHTALLANGKRVVATEQSLSVVKTSRSVSETQNPVKTTRSVPETQDPVASEPRTLLIKSDVNEKSVVQVAGIALKDSTTLSTYSVIVGSYTQPGKSVQLIEKLKQKSLSPFFVRNEKGMYRLVAGTFDNKDDADYLGIKLDVSDIEFWILERYVTPVAGVTPVTPK